MAHLFFGLMLVPQHSMMEKILKKIEKQFPVLIVAALYIYIKIMSTFKAIKSYLTHISQGCHFLDLGKQCRP